MAASPKPRRGAARHGPRAGSHRQRQDHDIANLWGERWSKLCQNGMKNGVSAATGLTGSDCDRNDAIRRFSIKLGGEAVRVGQALGYHIEKIGKMEP